jgi:hypothetical protein
VYALGDGVPRDDARAENLFRSGCGRGDATSCARLGSCYLRRGPDQPGYDFGIAQAATDCRSTAAACEWLGKVPTRVAKQAFGALVDTCDAEVPAACGALARAIAAGRVPRATAKVVLGRIRASCDEGKPLWCRRLAYWHEHGLSVAKDAVKARTFYRKACDAGDGRACTDLGRMLASGEGGERSETAALGLLRPACDKGGDSGAACSSLGMILLSHPGEADRLEGARLLDRACEAGDGLACQRLTSLHVAPALDEGVKVAREKQKSDDNDASDESRAADLLDRTCAAGGERCEEAQKLREKVGVKLE